jgi:murein DD-endopeptidase MepM/ murein hydrolase activator NlpD
LRKRFYILFVARGDDGQLRKISIPVHYLYIFVIGAAIGFLSLTGIASSYTRMLVKVARFNELRTEKEQLKDRYSRLEEVAKERDVQVASLGSIASEVSALYGLKSQPMLVTASQKEIQDSDVKSSLDQLSALRTSALTGAASVGISLGMTRNATTADWYRANSAPNLWPVEGQVTGSFGERIDPFNGEGAFHSGVDISSAYGTPIIAPADGLVTFADFMGGYGKALMVDHGHGISTRYGHLSGFAVTPGQHVHRGDVIGYVGLSGRSTGPHLHYEPLQVPPHYHREQRQPSERRLRNRVSVLRFQFFSRSPVSRLALLLYLSYVHGRKRKKFLVGSFQMLHQTSASGVTEN